MSEDNEIIRTRDLLEIAKMKFNALLLPLEDGHVLMLPFKIPSIVICMQIMIPTLLQEEGGVVLVLKRSNCNPTQLKWRGKPP
jgi:hypothetical protein